MSLAIEEDRPNSVRRYALTGSKILRLRLRKISNRRRPWQQVDKQKGIEVIRSLLPSDFDGILEVINDAAQAYKGVIPGDRWKEPYMSAEELGKEIEAGVRFFGWMEGEHLLGVAGIQALRDTTLIRHAYVLPGFQRKGVGTRLLKYLTGLVGTDEVLVGTWAAATWAIRFYEKHGFKLVSSREKDRLLRAYWNIPERQIETSVVLKASSSS